MQNEVFSLNFELKYVRSS